jgi:hypothetical protein
MSRLFEWLDHRMEVVTIDGWKDLAEQSGISAEALFEARNSRSLEILNRSQCRALAATLRVSLRKLEQLRDNAIDWIDDHDVYDFDAYGRPSPGMADDPLYWTPQEVSPLERGTPLVGRVEPNGQAEADEDWNPEWGKHIPKRFGKGYQIYALELESTSKFAVFRQVQPWEFWEGMAVIYFWDGNESKSWYGHVRLQPVPSVLTADGKRHELDLSNITRIGQVIGFWPDEAA